tara:strand:+ start:547 stop:1734 length:1188 start_codon:yes stop_codon:yes gene_type:complete
MVSNEQEYLFSLESKGIKLGLERTVRLLKKCKSPHKGLNVIQIVGTNGKGSTSAVLSKLLNLEYSVGLYTSPHLYSFNERIRVNGKPISNQTVSKFIKKFKPQIESVDASFFEVMTVMAVWYFSVKKVDYAIMETGLGGKFDSVTACGAKTIGISPISMDHSHILGETILEIANEKIAAISPRSDVFSVFQLKNINEKIKEKCKANNSRLNFVETDHGLNLSLRGDHQKQNASLALAISKNILKTTDHNIEKCLMSIKWHGRNQTIKTNPDIIFDVGHNEDGIKSFLKFLTNSKKSYRKKTLLLCIQKKKNIAKVSRRLDVFFDKKIYSTTNPARSMQYFEIKKYFNDIEYIKKPESALKSVLKNAQKNDLIAIVGTHYWGNSLKGFFNICFDNI